MSSLGEVGRFHQCQGWKPTYNSQLYNLPLFLVNSPGGQRKGDGCVLQPEPFREPTASPPHWPLSWVLWTQGRSLSWQPSSHDQWGQIPALQLGNWVLHSGSQSFLSHCFSIVTALKTHHVVPTQGTVCFLTLTSLVSACPRSSPALICGPWILGGRCGASISSPGSREPLRECVHCFGELVRGVHHLTLHSPLAVTLQLLWPPSPKPNKSLPS